MSGGGGFRDDGFRAPTAPRGGTADGPGPGGGGGGAIGGGGGGDGEGGGGGDGGEDQLLCDIVQRAPLNSPKPGVVAGLVVGDVLDVELDHSGGRPTLVVKDVHSAVAGALTHRGHLNLIRCIEAGWVYRAIVISKTGAMVELRIHPA